GRVDYPFCGAHCGCCLSLEIRLGKILLESSVGLASKFVQ
ncbi:MAG: hypothetical protein RL403_476, partial [Bacteroidota bacterium]